MYAYVPVNVDEKCRRKFFLIRWKKAVPFENKSSRPKDELFRNCVIYYDIIIIKVIYLLGPKSESEASAS